MDLQIFQVQVAIRKWGSSDQTYAFVFCGIATYCTRFFFLLLGCVVNCQNWRSGTEIVRGQHLVGIFLIKLLLWKLCQHSFIVILPSENTVSQTASEEEGGCHVEGAQDDEPICLDAGPMNEVRD